MRALKIVDGDLVIDENGEFVMIDGDEELVQVVETTLKTRQGEFFLDADHGLLFENIIGKPANQEEAHEDIVEAISQEERIASVEEILFSDDRKNRRRSISLILQKENGETLSIQEVEFDA